MKERNFVWLELRPQVKFSDDENQKALAITRRATEFAFFVMKQEDTIRIFVRTKPSEKKLFEAIPGMSVKGCPPPSFGTLAARYLVRRNQRLDAPLLDPKVPERGEIYQMIWYEKRDFVMACFASDCTDAALRRARTRARRLQSLERQRGVRLQAARREELAAAMQRLNGHHGYHDCCVLFGVPAPRRDGGKNATKQARRELDGFIGTVIPNSLKSMTARRSARISSRRQGLLRRIAEVVSGRVTIDPWTFVPGGFRPQGIVLSDAELAFFVSLPRQDEVQTMNFGIGPTPTFVHGPREEKEDTDVTFQR